MPKSNAADAARPPIRATLLRLLSYAKPYTALILGAVLLATVYAGARTFRAYLIKPLFDDVLVTNPGEAGQLSDLPGARWFGDLGGAEGESTARTADLLETAEPSEPDFANRVRESLADLLLAALAAITILPLAGFGKEYLAQYSLGRVLVDIQQDLCTKLLSLSLHFHHTTTRGDTLSRTMNDATRSQRALSLLFTDVLQSLLAILVGLVWLFSISWQLTLVTFVVAPLVVGLIAFFGRRIRKSALRRQETLSEMTQRLVEILSGIKVIQAFQAEAQEASSFGRENQRYFRRNMKVVKNRVLSKTLIEGLNNAVGMGILLMGAVLVLNGVWDLSKGDLAAFVAVMMTTYRPTRDLTKGWTQLMEALPAAERFFELLDHESEVLDAPDAVPLARIERGIQFKNVSFSYGREEVLRQLSVDVTAGEIVAIVGRTGSGKTTLADLLLRFYDPVSGSVEIDGVDLRKISRQSLLDKVAVVTQEPFLFIGTIQENIRYGRPGASDAEVEAAARVAHVHEFAESLPSGYDTQVGEAGARLSGGQRQRITIARALIRDPEILIFDEATSSLDAKSERYIQEAIQALSGGRTVFLIAHRLSTIRRADKIVVLEAGAISQVGSHRELVGEGGLYQELVSLQGGSGEAVDGA